MIIGHAEGLDLSLLGPIEKSKLRDAKDFEARRLANLDNNQAPVIGIVTQTDDLEKNYGAELANYTTYLMSAYPRFFQSYGARIVPILMNESDEVTLKKLKAINGVIFPGGNGDYMAKGKFILQKVKEFNDNGNFFPLYGICQGFEFLSVMTA